MNTSMNRGLMMAAAMMAAVMGRQAHTITEPEAAETSRRSQQRRHKAYENQVIRSLNTPNQIIDSLTNWQLCQLHKYVRDCGHGSVGKVPLEKLKEFAAMPHWKKARAATV